MKKWITVENKNIERLLVFTSFSLHLYLFSFVEKYEIVSEWRKIRKYW